MDFCLIWLRWHFCSQEFWLKSSSWNNAWGNGWTIFTQHRILAVTTGYSHAAHQTFTHSGFWKKKCFCCILMMFAIMNQVVTLQFLTKQWKVLKRLREKSVMTNWPLTIRYIVHPSNQSSVTHQAVVYSSWSEVLPFRHVYIFTGSSWST